jgi:hypothetical protein
MTACDSAIFMCVAHGQLCCCMECGEVLRAYWCYCLKCNLCCSSLFFPAYAWLYCCRLKAHGCSGAWRQLNCYSFDMTAYSFVMNEWMNEFGIPHFLSDATAWLAALWLARERGMSQRWGARLPVYCRVDRPAGCTLLQLSNGLHKPLANGLYNSGSSASSEAVRPKSLGDMPSPLYGLHNGITLNA